MFELIVKTLPGPVVDLSLSTQFQANNLDYNDYVGRLAVGRVKNGTLAAGQYVALPRRRKPANRLRSPRSTAGAA